MKSQSERVAEAVAAGGFGRLLTDAPVQPDVWLAFAHEKKDARLTFLITPSDGATAASVAAALKLAGAPPPVHVPGLVRARLTLAELVTVALPATRWWCASQNLDTARRERSLERLAVILAAFGDAPELPPPAAPGSSLGIIDRIAQERQLALAGAAPQPAPDPGDANRTIKADAAIRLFQPNCARLRWAVIDSGISIESGAFGKPDATDIAESRVDAIYNFADFADQLDVVARGKQARIAGLIGDRPDASALAAALRRRSDAGRDIDWEMLEPMLAQAPGAPPPSDDAANGRPSNHGTAVAGLLAANGAMGAVLGVCPDLRLLDIRVARPGSLTVAEFDVIAALKFLRFLNSRSEETYVHGANVSLQVEHDVRYYACGATPVCEEVDRAAASGIVVVVAAGNLGYRSLADSAGVVASHYLGMTIADPGNAEGAITVGSTHRRDPHRYGVSFFSGRGPTGDGRRKPDLVAPGEKITVLTATGGALEDQDGTSYAAPMVSGAAALLMARYPELVGHPARIKRILMESATDLGREHHFQGAGLLDVLRAMQWGKPS